MEPRSVPTGAAAPIEWRTQASAVTRAVVAMSGGVDSSVAALLIAQEQIPAIGVSMQVWDYRNNGGCSTRATCCAPDDFTDARAVAGSVGIPYYVFNLEEVFKAKVIDPFVATYQRGATPNPCVDCNTFVKFRELRERAARLGCSHVVTGHYAQIEVDTDGTFHLVRSVDANKDQTYFLYHLTQQELATTLFPIGGYVKSDVRALAEAAGLTTAQKAESQDICFVSGEAKDFVRKIGGGSKPGRIVTAQGQVLGAHEGIAGFTVGQRRGLAIGGQEEPLYVLHVNAETGAVTVGAKRELERDSFYVTGVSWTDPRRARQIGQEPLTCLVQVRHRHVPVPVTVREAGVSDTGESVVQVAFTDGWTPLAPGQAAVFYDLANRELLGGGRIAPPQM